MKLTVEIKDDKFEYSYEVGESKHNSTSHLSADMLAAFTDLLRVCSSVTRHNSREWERKMFEEQVRREMEAKQ